MKITPRTAERELKHVVDLGFLDCEGAGRSTVDIGILHRQVDVCDRGYHLDCPVSAVWP